LIQEKEVDKYSRVELWGRHANTTVQNILTHLKNNFIEFYRKNKRLETKEKIYTLQLTHTLKRRVLQTVLKASFSHSELLREKKEESKDKGLPRQRKNIRRQKIRL
jgi:hypothetical protein